MISISSRKKWVVMISGRGSNLQRILDHLSEIDVTLVVSSKKSAPGLIRAKRCGIATMVLEKNINWQKLSLEFKRRKTAGILLLGFMKIIPADFVEEWSGKIFNIHPSLLPDFPGANSLEESFQAKAAMGVTFHVVTEEMDKGPRIVQKKILPTESLQEAKMRIAIAEQRLVATFTERINLCI